MKAKCDNPITEEECLKVLKTFKNNKTPGNDGLTKEWYVYFWNVVKKEFMEAINYAFVHGQLSVSQRQAIITLLEKPNKDRLDIKN